LPIISKCLSHWPVIYVDQYRLKFSFKFKPHQTCAAIYQLLLHMMFTSRNWFAMQGPVAIILISWNVLFIWETGYWTRAIKRFALFDLLQSLYSDTKITWSIWGFLEQSTTILNSAFASLNIVVLCPTKPHIDLVQVQ
jgi:hypothetical protein